MEKKENLSKQFHKIQPSSTDKSKLTFSCPTLDLTTCIFSLKTETNFKELLKMNVPCVHIMIQFKA